MSGPWETEHQTGRAARKGDTGREEKTGDPGKDGAFQGDGSEGFCPLGSSRQNTDTTLTLHGHANISLRELGVEKRDPSYTVGGNVNWCSHCGEHYGGFLKN